MDEGAAFRVETDVPIAAEDRAAQGWLRDEATLTFKDYLDWCSWITRDAPPHRRDFPRQPFEL